MLLLDETQVLSASLPLAALKDHLRLGTGFGDDTLQDGVLETHLRAAIATVESRIGKVLIEHRFRLLLNDWPSTERYRFTVAPVTVIQSVTFYDKANVASVLAPTAYRLVKDKHRPQLEGVSWLLPSVPDDGRVEVIFDAGFGASWANVPSDLQQAVLILAAEFYERRSAGEGAGLAMPVALQGLLSPWFPIRTFGGARS